MPSSNYQMSPNDEEIDRIQDYLHTASASEIQLAHKKSKSCQKVTVFRQQTQSP